MTDTATRTRYGVQYRENRSGFVVTKDGAILGDSRAHAAEADALAEARAMVALDPSARELDAAHVSSADGEDFPDDDLPEDDLDALIAADAAPVKPDAALLPGAGLVKEPCSKCHGSGRFTSWSGRSLGACFTCNGTGFKTYKNAAPVRAANRAKVADRKAAKTAENIAAFKAANSDVWQWLDGNDFPFAVSMREALNKWGSLTERQLAACVTCIQKRDAGIARKAEREANAATVSTDKLEACFAKASSSLKNPRLRLAGLTISRAKATSANAGALYVKADGGTYLGKIKDGRFFTSRECNAEDEARVLAACASPLDAAIQYGRLTGQCACCGRTLTKGESIERGIGPICAAQWGM
jgi:hypothetical protein